MKTIGLRIDVDTFRGTRFGVPNLLRLLSKKSIRSSFFFCVGPDNMGRHLWRLLRPAFLWKMLRTNAASLYGIDILLRGTFWPGPHIGKKCAATILDAKQAGHEIGIHAWDHHLWQRRVETMSNAAIYREIDRGVLSLAEITGERPVCSAAPGWRCTDAVLMEKDKFSFRYNSDCRGTNIFQPIVGDKPTGPLQIPVTLPTYDETVGNNGITNAHYNDYIISLLRPNSLNVLTVHAEAEGIICLEMFEDFIDHVQNQGWKFVPLGSLIPEDTSNIPKGRIFNKNFPGREGWVSQQEV